MKVRHSWGLDCYEMLDGCTVFGGMEHCDR